MHDPHTAPEISAHSEVCFNVEDMVIEAGP
jgi:hypothetical protein